MKSLTNDQLKKIKLLTIEALRGQGFSDVWLIELKRCFDIDSDMACNALELARYVSWNMRSSNIHRESEDFANVCALECVLFATNEVIALKIN